MRQYNFLQHQWTHAKRHTHRKDGDFWNADGMYPTPDRQQLRRAPGWSTFANWQGDFQKVGGAFSNVYAGIWDNPYYDFIGQDSVTGDLALIEYEGAGWNAAITYTAPYYDLAVTDTQLRGRHKRNHLLWYSQDLFYIATSDQDVYKSANLGAGAMVFDGNANDKAQILLGHGDRIYIVTITGEVWKSNDAADGFTQYFDPAPFLHIHYATASGHYLTLFGMMEDGTFSVFRLPLNHDSPELQPVFSMRGLAAESPSANKARNHQMQFAQAGRHVYFLSGHYPEFDNTRLDLYRFDGNSADKVAEAHDLANPYDEAYAFGLEVWHEEVLLYQIAQDATWIRMLVGDRFIDFADLSSTSPWNTANLDGYSAMYNLVGRLFLCGQDATDYGFTHAQGLSDGHVISSWLDFDRPGQVKRLNRLTAHVEDWDSNVTVTLSYKCDDDSSWTQAAATANSDRIALDNIGAEFYRLQLKLAIAQSTGTPVDTRLDSLAVNYTVEGM